MIDEKYSIAYVIPYFGKLRDDFCVWLKSCEYNQSIDFILFIDDLTPYKYPSNVHVRKRREEDTVAKW